MMPVNNSKTGCPFPSNAAFLEEELKWLNVRVRRILTQRKLAETLEQEEEEPEILRRPGRIGSRESKCQLIEVRERESKLRADLDIRVQGHLQAAGCALGLHEICAEFNLSGEERLILLVGLPLAVSQHYAERVLGEMLTRYFGSITVADTIAFLDPQGLDDWLRFRALFEASAPLRRFNLVDVRHSAGPQGPESVSEADLRLTADGFQRMTGYQGAGAPEGEE